MGEGGRRKGCDFLIRLVVKPGNCFFAAVDEWERSGVSNVRLESNESIFVEHEYLERDG